MKFKALLFACAFLVIVTASNADSKQKFKTRFVDYVKQNSARVAHITVGVAEVAFNVCAINLLRKEEGNIPTVISLGLCWSVGYRGYHTLNDALNNKPNDAIKNLIQKAKAQLQKPKVHEQK